MKTALLRTISELGGKPTNKVCALASKIDTLK